jgi:hypothetical protein
LDEPAVGEWCERSHASVINAAHNSDGITGSAIPEELNLDVVGHTTVASNPANLDAFSLHERHKL